MAAATKLRKEQLLEVFIEANGTVAFGADQSMGTHKLTDLAAGVAGSNDAARMVDLQNAKAGLDVKDSVRAATVGADITLSGTQTIDDVPLSAGDRILVKDQAQPKQNGIYVVAAGVWSRATDADSSAKVTPDLFVFVEEGTLNQDTGWVLTTNAPINLDTTDLAFAQFTGAGSLNAGAGLTKTGNTINVIAADNTLTVSADSMQVKLDPAGAITVGAPGIKENLDANGGLQISGNAMGIKLNGASLAVGASGISLNTAKFITRETPTGTVGGGNKVFTLASAPVVGSENVFLNGLLQDVGAGNDYTISGVTVTFETAPLTGDKIRVNYMSQ